MLSSCGGGVRLGVGGRFLDEKGLLGIHLRAACTLGLKQSLFNEIDMIMKVSKHDELIYYYR